MKKALLIEDRRGRQEQFLSSKLIIQLSGMQGITLPLESECKRIIDNLNLGKIENLIEYNLIIIHKSPLVTKGLNALNFICTESKIDLILFSGGIGQLNYQHDTYGCLSINSKDLYSIGLIDFLEKYILGKTQNLLELLYGTNWKLAFLLQYRQLKIIRENETSAEYQVTLDEELKLIKDNIGIDLQNIDLEISTIIATL